MPKARMANSKGNQFLCCLMKERPQQRTPQTHSEHPLMPSSQTLLSKSYSKWESCAIWLGKETKQMSIEDLLFIFLVLLRRINLTWSSHAGSVTLITAASVVRRTLILCWFCNRLHYLYFRIVRSFFSSRPLFPGKCNNGADYTLNIFLLCLIKCKSYH